MVRTQTRPSLFGLRTGGAWPTDTRGTPPSSGVSIAVYCTVLCCTVLCCIVLSVLYRTVLYSKVKYCTVLSCSAVQADLYNEVHPNTAFPDGAPYWEYDAGVNETYNFRSAVQRYSCSLAVC